MNIKKNLNVNIVKKDFSKLKKKHVFIVNQVIMEVMDVNSVLMMMIIK